MCRRGYLSQVVLLLLLACIRHPIAPAPTPEGCQAGDFAMCRRLAALAEDLPTGRALDRWACDQGHAPSCRALADAESGTERVADLLAACRLGDTGTCELGAALPDDPAQVLAIGEMALASCTRARSKAACIRADALGWRGPEVRDVRVVPKIYGLTALLPGGTPVAWWGDGVHAWSKTGRLDFLTPASSATVDPSHIRHIAVTPEGHIVAQAIQPLLVWDAMTGAVTRLDTWPPDPDSIVQALADDGSALTARLDGFGVLTWSLPGGKLLGVVPDPGKGLAGLRLGRRGERLALVGASGWAAAEPARSPSTEPRTGPWEGWLSGVDLPAGTPDRASVSPDGRLVAVPGPDGVRLLRRDGAEVAHVQLGPIHSDHRVLYAPVWSPDGGRLLVRLEGRAVVISTSTATSSEADDRALFAKVQPLPALPGAPPPTFVGTADAQGSVSAAGVPVAGAEVRAEPCVPGPTPRTGQTGADGTFVIAAMAQGCWKFTATGSGGLPADSERVTVGKEDAHLELIATHAVSGVVLDADGRPAPGVGVRARLRDKVIPRGSRGREHVVVSEAVTDRGGRFTLAQAPVEQFTIEAIRGGEAVHALWPTRGPPPELRLKPALIVETDEDPHCNYTQVIVERTDGRTATGVFESGSWIGTDYAPGETLRLHIRELYTDGPTVSVTLPTDRAVRLESIPWGSLHVKTVPGAEVWLENNLNCEVHAGECQTQWLPAGRYRVGVRAPDHRVGIVEVEMRAGVVTDVDVPLTLPTTTVSGRVVDPHGRPLPGVRVEVPSWRRDTSGATTGPDGRFSIDGLAAAALIAPFAHVEPRTLRATGGGWTALVRDLAIPDDGASLDLGDLVLQPT